MRASFYKNMTFKDKVIKVLNKSLEEKPELFLIDIVITENFKIIITIDGDNGVILQNCIDISRSIEDNLDREEQDFMLEVASAGVSSPLKLIRQYKKNVGRTLIVKLENEKFEGKLIEANEKFIILTWETRESKKIGKGKETVQKTKEIPYNEIIEAIVTITF